ncbi:MAG TPA: THUMP domain-containing protein [Candidatus Eisenbacteria bacterium]
MSPSPRSPFDAPARFLVTAPAGLSGLLRDELAELGCEAVLTPAGVAVVEGGWDVAARILIRSRIGSRLLLSVREFSARTSEMLYNQVRRVDWRSLFPPTMSIAINGYGTADGTDYKLSFAPLKIKDAVCDEFRKLGGPRPDVDRMNPDVRMAAFFFNGRCELSIDLCGRPMHRRGYRAEGAAAPIRENRAAALLRFAGYDGAAPLIDPFCGSGTIPIEAAWIARRMAPGLARPVESWAGARLIPALAEALEAERGAAMAEVLPEAAHPIVGRDIDATTLATARSNARLAGVDGNIRFESGDARDLAATGGWIVANPPYGERLAEGDGDAAALISDFVRRVKHHGTGATLGLVLPRGEMAAAVGLKPKRKLPLESGPLGLSFLIFEIYAGSRRPARA